MATKLGFVLRCCCLSLLLFLGISACSSRDTSVTQSSQDSLNESVNAHTVVSLDYCADQFVLRFVPQEQIAAVSPDARKYFSFMRDAHPNVPAVRPTAEDVLSLKPTRVVRSYGGGPGAAAFFERAGIEVVQLGYSATLDDVRKHILDIASRLGNAKEGQEVAAEFDRRLANVKAQAGNPRALYTTPGGVTTGPGSLVHEMMTAAGMVNYEQRGGWRDMPLERLVNDRPEQLAKATFGAPDTHVDPWTRSRHPLAREIARSIPGAELEGAWTSCGAWFLIEAIEAMAQVGQRDSQSGDVE
ncbi:MAG: ABC transporter substrate-binding protein [Gammaproteobacteria bacterium]